LGKSLPTITPSAPATMETAIDEKEAEENEKELSPALSPALL
jgi:hypothetical protein